MLLTKRIRQFLYVVRHPVSHVALRKIIARASNHGVAPREWSLHWKYAGRYLDTRIDAKTRRELIANHYQWMMEAFPPALFSHNISTGISVWDSVDKTGEQYSITLRPSITCPMEGELELVFQDTKGPLAFLTFLIVSGPRLGVNAGLAILIGGVQGEYGRREDFRRAAKNNGEITPINYLIKAIKAFADAAGATSLLGMPDEGQIARLYADHLMHMHYNRTWIELGGEPTRFGYFALDIHNAPPRSLDHLSAPHRARARRKMKLKEQLGEQMRERFSELLQPEK